MKTMNIPSRNSRNNRRDRTMRHYSRGNKQDRGYLQQGGRGWLTGSRIRSYSDTSSTASSDDEDCRYYGVTKSSGSGRYGRKGIAINFVTNYDKERIKQIEQYYSTEILELPDLNVFTF